jgi:hypothetical protein
MMLIRESLCLIFAISEKWKIKRANRRVHAIAATLRANGDYDIPVEDDARGEILMLQWKP